MDKAVRVCNFVIQSMTTWRFPFADHVGRHHRPNFDPIIPANNLHGSAITPYSDTPSMRVKYNLTHQGDFLAQRG